MSYVDDYIARLDSIKAARTSMEAVRPSATKSELANLILRKAHSEFQLSAPVAEKKKEERGFWGDVKSVGQGVLDVLSRPLYGVAEAVDSGLNETRGDVGETIKGFGQGFSGREKTDFIDVLKTAEKRGMADDKEIEYLRSLGKNEDADALLESKRSAVDKSKLLSAAGLGLDLVLDPINLVPGAVVAAPFKAAKNLIRTDTAINASEDVLGLAAAENAGEQALTGGVQGTSQAPEITPPAAFLKPDAYKVDQPVGLLTPTTGTVPLDRVSVPNLPESVPVTTSEEVTRVIPGGEQVVKKGSKKRLSLADIVSPQVGLTKTSAKAGSFKEIAPEVTEQAKAVVTARKIRMRRGLPPIMTPNERAFATIWDDVSGATGRSVSDLSILPPNALQKALSVGDDGVRLKKPNAKGSLIPGPTVSLQAIHNYLLNGEDAERLGDLVIKYKGENRTLKDIKNAADSESASGEFLLQAKRERERFRRADPNVDPSGSGYERLVSGIAQYELNPARYGFREMENPEFFGEFRKIETALRRRKIPDAVLNDVRDTWADLVAANGGKPLPQEQFTKMVEDVIDEYDPSILGDKSITEILPEKTVKEKVTKTEQVFPDKSLAQQLRQDERFVDLPDLLSGKYTAAQFKAIQKAQITQDAAILVDEVAEGSEAAVAALTRPLTKATEREVNTAFNVVNNVRKTIDSANPVKTAENTRPKHPSYNAPKQSNVSNQLAQKAAKLLQQKNPKIAKPHAPAFIPAVYGSYLRMLKNVEDQMVMGGIEKYIPRLGNQADGPYIRLSDVLERLGTNLGRQAILGPKNRVLVTNLLNGIGGSKAALKALKEQNQAVYDAVVSTDWTDLMSREYAIRTIGDTEKVKPIVDDASDMIQAKATDPMLSESAKADGIKDIRELVNDRLKSSMPETRSSISDLLKSIADQTSNKVSVADQIIEGRKKKLVDGIRNTSSKPAQMARIDTAKAVNDEIVPQAFKVAKYDAAVASQLGEAGMFSTVMKWFKPNFGYAQLRPLLLKNVGVRKASAAIRAHDIKEIFKLVPPDRHDELWQTAVGNIPAVDDAMEKASMSIQKIMGNLFIESGLKDAAAGNTATARAGLSVDELNRHLRIVGVKDFKFGERQLDAATGKEEILTGLDILSSWRYHKPSNPQEFMFRMSQAAENSMVEYSTWANIAGIWGSKIPRKGDIEVSGFHPGVDGLHFPRDIAQEMGKVAHGIDEFYEPLSNNDFIKLYDQVLRTWKSGVTIYAPSHHIRNMVGDMFMSWLDGVNNPKYYARAGKIILANRNRYSDVIGSNKLPMGQLLGSGREQEILTEMLAGGSLPKGTHVMATVRAGKKSFKLDADRVYQMGFRHGLFPHSNVIEDLPGSETLFEAMAQKNPKAKRIFQPLGGKGQQVAREVSESREHIVRMAHYLHALENTKADSLEDLFYKAAQRVRKYHPDGLDLTSAEKQVMRRLFPFYSWTRKAIPLILEGVVTQPHKIMAYPKIQHAMAESQGITDTEISQPYPEDQLFPDWLSGNVIGPTFDPTSEIAKFFARSEGEEGYVITNPGNPATDILEDYFNNPAKGILGSLTPGIKMPMEILSGTDMQTGAPIQDKTEYIDKNVPILAHLSRITNGALGSGLVEGGDLKGKETDPLNQAALINYLTGLGILDTGRYIKGAEFDLKERLRKENGN